MSFLPKFDGSRVMLMCKASVGPVTSRIGTASAPQRRVQRHASLRLCRHDGGEPRSVRDPAVGVSRHEQSPSRSLSATRQPKESYQLVDGKPSLAQARTEDAAPDRDDAEPGQVIGRQLSRHVPVNAGISRRAR